MNIRNILKKSVARKTLLAMCKVLSLVNRIVPKDKTRVLFYDSMGSTFYDNTRAVFEYMKHNGYFDTYHAVVCIPNPRDYLYLNGPRVRVVGMAKGVWHYMRAKYVFFSFSTMRITPTKGQVVISQWHGSPLKRIGILEKDKLAKREKLDYFSYLLSAADGFVPIMADAFGCSEDRVAVFGHTRNDYLFSKADVLGAFGINRSDYDKFLLWMPTFRVSSDHRYVDIGEGDSLGDTMLPLLTTYESLEEMNEYLRQKKVYLALKIHNYSVFTRLEYSNIHLYTTDEIENKGFQLYEFVKEFDALLTDYSSIYFDYLLLDRPIGFTLDDYDSYLANRGFSLENALSYLPGHHIYTKEDLFRFVDDLCDERDDYRAERKRINDFSNKYQDDQNCLRLLTHFGIKKQ